MTSAKLSFNRAVAKNLLRRCWPAWAVYFGYLLLSFVVPFVNNVRTKLIHPDVDPLWQIANTQNNLLHSGIFQAKAGIVFGVLLVMVLFSFLFTSRGNTLMSSLPIRRGDIFLTVYLTGLIPTLLLQAVAAALAMLLTISCPCGFGFFVKWFLCAALGFVFFYGFACFCAMLTGNFIILPAVYLVLNLTAVVFESCVRAALSGIIYGMSWAGYRFRFLSPIVEMDEVLQAEISRLGGVSLHGFGMLAAYAAAGLVFALLAAVLYRRRKAECVSDFVAIPILKPIFRYCMGFGTAFVFATVLMENLFSVGLYGVKKAALLAVLLLIGALLGWMIAEMLIRRTVRIHPMPWRGLLVICAVCLLLVTIAESDLTGYEKRVPAPEQVDSVEIAYNTRLREPENLALVTDLHREVVRDKALYDQDRDSYLEYSLYLSDQNYSGEFAEDEVLTVWLPFRYTLKNGSSLQRTYLLRFHPSDVDNPGSTVGKLLTILNSQEGIDDRATPSIPVSEDTIEYAAIHIETTDSSSRELRLSLKEAVDLWESAMLPDAEAGELSIYTLVDTAEKKELQTNLRIYLFLHQEAGDMTQDWSHNFRVFTFSENTLRWIKEHTDLTWMTLNELDIAREAWNQEHDLA